ncbi:diguanylate cyclase [Photobacterium aquae]|uniref:diguanylate cyclase n=1 Tax=Photobacterium aquae TaxID=1195763 RepID=A0A0J1GPR3_9GAMM|nr:diguanylate cyclase [Photobacterium aquae]KLV01631.1 diguanylate cyclase [Photobacterium aquae]
MTDINAVASELSQLKLRLDQAQLSYRDETLKSRRELIILKRLISRLAVACRGIDSELDDRLDSLRLELEQHKDISKLLPRIAVIERLVSRMANFAEQENAFLSQQIHHSGEVLRRVHGLPPQLKRDLRNLLSQPNTTLSQTHQQAVRLIALYDRALKLAAHFGPSNGPSEAAHDLQLKLASELQHLITELDFDGDAGSKLLTIRNQLLVGVQPTELTELSLDVLRLVLEGTRQERRSSQQFLDKVSGDISTLHKTTQQSAEQSNMIYEHRCEMTRELAELANSIRQGLAENQNLDGWRSELTTLTKELVILSERNKALEKREKALLEQLSYNGTKLTNLYDQTQDYRQRLTDQEHRMFLDNLTRVYNRAAINERLEHEYRRWLRYQHPLCVALVDIDGFKSINEKFGHVAGDKILKIIAKTLRQQIADTDVVARFSDDAFMLVMPDVNEDERNKRLGVIRESISQLPFRFRDKNVTITASIGATLFDANDTPSDIIERTEKALLSARSAGNSRLIWIS